MGLKRFNLGISAWEAAVKVAARVACLCPGVDRQYHVKERLSGPWPAISQNGKKACLWLHGASLGECRMLVGLARALKEDLHDCPPLLITSQKVEVVSYLRDVAEGAAEVAIAPADIPSALNAFIGAVQPLGLILAENELWPGYLFTLSRISVRPSIALVSGRYRRSWPYLDFSGIGFASLQTMADFGRFARACDGCVPCVVGGDWKLLSWVRESGTVSAPRNPSIDVSFLSFHQEESQAFLCMAKIAADKGETIVLMPRRLSELNQFRRQLQDAGLPVVDYPLLRKGAVSLISRFGLSREILSNSRRAVVGGSFVRSLGIHDFWEPLQMGVATCVGPYAKGHEDVVENLIRARVLARVKSPEDFAKCRFTPVDCVRAYLETEKMNVSESYSMLLKFIKGLL